MNMFNKRSLVRYYIQYPPVNIYVYAFISWYESEQMILSIIYDVFSSDRAWRYVVVETVF